MPLSNAERQRRYRARHLGRDLTHVTLDIGLGTRDQLDRLAWHDQCSVTELVEKLAVAAELAVEAKLTGAALRTYRAAGYEDTAFGEAR